MQTSLLEKEKGFWLNGADYYERNISSDCVMLMPGVPKKLFSEQIIDMMKTASRWEEVEVTDFMVEELVEALKIVTYKVKALKENESDYYSALVSSLYRRDGDSYKLIFHQQSKL
jgi:hypothetical protein